MLLAQESLVFKVCGLLLTGVNIVS
jgi:hypothetical protein